MAAWNIPTIAGELELARRHTYVEFKDECAALSKLEFAVLTRDRAYFCKNVGACLDSIGATVSARLASTEESKETGKFEITEIFPDASNPLIGELHLYAAYRLAQEVGYMLPNRSMIIGDLALAREHLARTDYALGTRLRELRHRVQTTRAADLNIYWPYVCDAVARMLDDDAENMIEPYVDGLRDYLGVAR